MLLKQHQNIFLTMGITRTPSLNSYQLHSEEPSSIFRMATMYNTCSASVGVFPDFVTKAVWYSAFNSDSWPPEACNYIRYLSWVEISFKIWSSFHTDSETKMKTETKTEILRTGSISSINVSVCTGTKCVSGRRELQFWIVPILKAVLLWNCNLFSIISVNKLSKICVDTSGYLIK